MLFRSQAVGKRVFDLSFYVRFRPQFVQLEEQSIAPDDSQFRPLQYLPPTSQGKQRVAVVIPQLGPGGAESVLLDMVSALDRDRFEILLIATQSKNDLWRERWSDYVTHIYDLAQVIPPDRMVATVYTIVQNWHCDLVIVQNTMYGYAALQHIKRSRPQTKAMDVVHAIDENWDQAALTAEFAPAIDTRVALSFTAQRRLIESGTAAERVKLLHGGIQLDRFSASPVRQDGKQIFYAGRLDAFKRPLLLLDIAERLRTLRGGFDFRFVIAGEGPEPPRILTGIARSEQKAA